MFYFSKLKRNALPPIRATLKSAGFDLSTYKSEVLKSGETCKIPLGLRLYLPPDCYGKQNIFLLF